MKIRYINEWLALKNRSLKSLKNFYGKPNAKDYHLTRDYAVHRKTCRRYASISCDASGREGWQREYRESVRLAGNLVIDLPFPFPICSFKSASEQPSILICENRMKLPSNKLRINYMTVQWLRGRSEQSTHSLRCDQSSHGRYHTYGGIHAQVGRDRATMTRICCQERLAVFQSRRVYELTAVPDVHYVIEAALFSLIIIDEILLFSFIKNVFPDFSVFIPIMEKCNLCKISNGFAPRPAVIIFKLQFIFYKKNI